MVSARYTSLLTISSSTLTNYTEMYSYKGTDRNVSFQIFE